MLTSCVRRTILFLLFVTLLASAWPAPAVGAQRADVLAAQTSEPAISKFFDRFWSLLLGVEGKDGCHIDPFGRCKAAQNPEPQRKDGCHIDPDGRCLP